MSRLIQYWLRGGSWFNLGYYCRSAVRNFLTPDTRNSKTRLPGRDGGGEMSVFTRYWLRGGSWYVNGYGCRSANRVDVTPDTRSVNVGFRVVRGGGK